MDIVFSVLALALLCPILLITGLVVVIESPGNPLYFGWRVGKNGVRFRMWKFRTMVKNASKTGGSITGRNDPRITRVGRLLRKTKLDELPQFVNVLRGDMTLVGPRPESPDIVDLYTAGQRRILEVKPGVTGRMQLDSGEESESLPEGIEAQRYYVTHLMHEKLERDLEYLGRRTVFTDARIVLETATYVFRSCFRR